MPPGFRGVAPEAQADPEFRIRSGPAVVLGARLLARLALAVLMLAGIARAGIEVLRSDAQGVTLQLEFGAAAFLDVPGQGQKIDLVDCIRFGALGQPDLPQLRVWCGVSQHGPVRLSFSAEQQEEIADCEIAPAQDQVALSDLDQQLGSAANQFAPRSPCYQQDEFWPPKLVELEGIELLRAVRVARLLVSPVQYNPIQRRVRITHKVFIRLVFAEPARSSVLSTDDPFDYVYSSLLANASAARTWRVTDSVGFDSSARDRISFFDRSPVWVKIAIESTGVYRVTYDDLARAGCSPRFIDPTTLQLFAPGEHDPTQYYPDTMHEIPIYVYGAADSVFNRDDYLLFFARGLSEWNRARTTFARNLYTRNNIYWLTWGVAPGRRMAQSFGPPLASEQLRKAGREKVRVEQDRLSPERCGLLWVWNVLEKPAGASAVSYHYDLELAHPVWLEELSGRMYANASATNRIQLRLNDQLLDSVAFRDRPYSVPFDFNLRYDSTPCPGLDSLKSILTLTMAGDSNMQAYIDYFDVSYGKRLRADRFGAVSFFVVESTPQTFSVERITGSPLVLNVTNPENPYLITGFARAGDSLVFRVMINDTASFYVTDFGHLRRPRSIERRMPGRLRALAGQVDYLIVAPEQLFAPAQALARYRTGNIPGLRSARCRIVHLAEVYDDFAFGRAEPVAIRQLFATLRPSYGLLLGDASYDYRDQLGLNPLPGVPPWETGFYLPQPGYGSPAAARDAWYSDFDGDGYTPDMILGRITCRTPDELNAYLRKLTRYELGNRGSWCRRVILLADDEWIGYDQPGYEDRIGLDHVTYCENINGHWGPVFEPVKVYLTEFPFVAFGEKPGARDMLHRALEQGALLMCFFGHGDGANLTREAALTLQEIPSLNNEGRSPFCFFGSCGVGRWDDTRNECIAEELTRLTGAIATVGASKATAAQSNLFFAQRLFDSLLHNPGISVGQAFTAALPTTPIYHLFGDPCLHLALPDTGGRVYLNGDTLGHGRRYRFGGVLPVSQGFVASTLFGPKWLRTYRTTNRYAHPNPVTYVLSGEELYRGIHRVTDRMFQGEFLVPAHPTRGIRPVVNGSYLEVARSTRLSLVGFSGGASWALLKDGLALDSTPVAQADSAGPELTLAADGRQLLPSETNAVASSFTLRGRVSDPSGILISPAQTGEAFYLYQNDFRQRLPLADRFSYDLESCTSGTFSLPITLTGTIDSLVVVASDNFLNYSTVRVLVRASVSGALTISNPLVFPNPVTGPALFTFQISEPAAVTIRIHTLSGRLVRMIEQLEGTSGYNQVPWDGCDQAGVSVPSGVYLYSVTARKSIQSIEPREQETIIRDRLVVRR